MTEKTSARLFFALWPDEAVRSHLTGVADSLRQTVSGKWVKPDNLHITLAFLGEVDEMRWPELHRIGAEMTGPGFTLELDCMEFWPRNSILCLAPRRTPEALVELASALAERLRGAGFAMESRPYKAHLTLARKGQSDRTRLELAKSIIWKVPAFSLMESRLCPEGSIYLPWHTWPLRDPKAIAAGPSMP